MKSAALVAVHVHRLGVATVTMNDPADAPTVAVVAESVYAQLCCVTKYRIVNALDGAGEVKKKSTAPLRCAPVLLAATRNVDVAGPVANVESVVIKDTLLVLPHEHAAGTFTEMEGVVSLPPTVRLAGANVIVHDSALVIGVVGAVGAAVVELDPHAAKNAAAPVIRAAPM